jgi:hypothetical protein
MKVAICIPHYGDLKAGFVASLSALLIESAREHQIGVAMARNPIVSVARTVVVVEAINANVDYLLLLDTDQTFPPETLKTLLAHKVAMVGANIVRKQPPFTPTTINLKGQNILSSAGMPLEEVSRTSLGVCLVSIEVFRTIERKAIAEGRKPLPIFAIETGDDGGAFGEDYFFCQRVREAGEKIHVDHNLSMLVGHIGEHVYTQADAAAYRTRAALRNLSEAGTKDEDSIVPAAGAG